MLLVSCLLNRRLMKKTDKKQYRNPKLVVRIERLRELDTTQLDQVIGGVFEYRSLQSSCC